MRSVLKLFIPLLALQIVALLAGIVLYPNWQDAVTVPLLLPFVYVFIGLLVAPDKTRLILYVGFTVLFWSTAAALCALMIDTAIDHFGLILVIAVLVVFGGVLAAKAVHESRPYRR